jgi:phosphoesterase RecJ-like protein
MQERFSLIQLIPVKDLLQVPKRIAITTHHRPDGDAIGSSLGLYNFLLKKGHSVSVITPSDYPDFLQWMSGNDKVLNYESRKEIADEKISKAEIIFCLDFNRIDRVEKMEKALRKSAATKILIDHHLQPENVFQHVFSYPESCATCELVFQFIISMGDVELIDKNIAACLYAGIMTDTQSFRFENMRAETHRIVAQLIERGAVNYKIHESVYDNSTEDRLRLLGHCLKDKLVVLREYNTAYISLSQEELDKYNFQSGDSEGVVNYALSIEGIRLAAFAAPRDGSVKISFRSKGDFSVNELAAKQFEGGGHKNAAGGKTNLSLEETIKKFLEILRSYKTELNK